MHISNADDIRRRIKERIDATGVRVTTLSESLGKNRGYLTDFLGGSPRELSYEIKLRLASLLNLDPRELGIAEISHPPQAASGLRDDGVPYKASGDIPVPPLHIALFEVRSRVLNQHPEQIEPGHILAMDINIVEPARIAPGRIVVVQVFDKHDLLVSHGTIFRQFIPPNKLITNSSEHNAIDMLDDPTSNRLLVIKGALSYVLRHASAAWSKWPATAAIARDA